MSSPSGAPLLRVDGLCVDFRTGRGRAASTLRAVDDVSFDVDKGEILGIVGESGSGKSTVANAITGLIPSAGGRIVFRGEDLVGNSARALRATRRAMQLVFQDPLASLNPRMTVGAAVAEGLVFLCPELDQTQRDARVAQALSRVGLDHTVAQRYPHEFSGGQRQRISIARAIVVEPDLLICDESVSALDVSVQAQILNLLLDLRRELNMGILFISHDMAVVRQVCDRILVLYYGRVVELGPSADVIADPRHPYTVKLMQSIPRIRDTSALPEPSAVDPDHNPRAAPGCNYASLCPLARPDCDGANPSEVVIDGGAHRARCLFPDQARALGQEVLLR